VLDRLKKSFKESNPTSKTTVLKNIALIHFFSKILWTLCI
jgi:hypothetical protein